MVICEIPSQETSEKLANYLLNNELIPLPQLRENEKVFVEPLNFEASECTSTTWAVRIGIETASDQEYKKTTLYILKYPTRFRDKEEAYWITKAYDACQTPIIEAVVSDGDNRKSCYRLGFAWHEKIFAGQYGYFELLHCAKGSPLKKFYEAFIFGEKKTNIILRIDGSISGADSYLDEHCWGSFKEAMEAWGATLGAFFREYHLPLNHRGFDLHSMNVFYDPHFKKITLIDNEGMGKFLFGMVLNSRSLYLCTLSFAIPSPLVFPTVFPEFDSRLSRDEELKRKALAEFHTQAIASIMSARYLGVKEAFSKAFSENYGLLPSVVVIDKLMKVFENRGAIRDKILE
jgi:hypothetical protein